MRSVKAITNRGSTKIAESGSHILIYAVLWPRTEFERSVRSARKYNIEVNFCAVSSNSLWHPARSVYLPFSLFTFEDDEANSLLKE